MSYYWAAVIAAVLLGVATGWWTRRFVSMTAPVAIFAAVVAIWVASGGYDEQPDEIRGLPAVLAFFFLVIPATAGVLAGVVLARRQR